VNQANNQAKAYLLAMVAVVFWSTMSSAFKITLRHMPFDYLLMWASLTGVILLGLVNQLGKSPLRSKDLNRQALFSSAVMGLINPFLYYLVLFRAYELLEAQIAGTLNYAWPIVLVLLSVPLLRQRISLLSLFAILISFFGILVISTQGRFTGLHGVDPLGVMLALGSAFLWSFYWILNLKDKRELTGKIGMNMAFGFVYIASYLIVSPAEFHVPKGDALVGVLYIGAFEMGITFVVWLMALSYSSNTAKVSHLIYLSPFFALFWIHLAVGEPIRNSTIIGLAFIVLGIVLQQLFEIRQKK
jgi:drug/metabolite transporter (DMT)-like permease